MKSLNDELDAEIDQIATVEGSNVNYGQSLSSNLYELLQNAEQVKNEFGDATLLLIHLRLLLCSFGVIILPIT